MNGLVRGWAPAVRQESRGKQGRLTPWKLSGLGVADQGGSHCLPLKDSIETPPPRPLTQPTACSPLLLSPRPGPPSRRESSDRKMAPPPLLGLSTS